MSELQQNRYDQLVRRVGGIIGPGSKVSEVISELFPMIDVENLPPELLVLAGWDPAFRSTDVSSGVGNENASQLFNPAGSGKLIVLTKIILGTNKDASVRFNMTHTQLANSNGFGVHRDNRAGDLISSAAVGNTRIEFGLLISAGATIFVQASITQQLEDVNGLAILTPGDGFVIGTLETDLAMRVTYFWRERTAEQSELNF